MDPNQANKDWQQWLDGRSDDVAFLETHLGDAGQALSRDLRLAVDASEFTLSEWVAALRVLADWLQQQQRTLPMPDQIGYIECVCAAAGAGAHLSDLASLLEEMLQLYGCERALKK